MTDNGGPPDGHADSPSDLVHVTVDVYGHVIFEHYTGEEFLLKEYHAVRLRELLNKAWFPSEHDGQPSPEGAPESMLAARKEQGDE